MRVYVHSPGHPAPRHAARVVTDLRGGCLSWLQDLSPYTMGPVWVWDGIKAKTLHSGLTATCCSGSDAQAAALRTTGGLPLWARPRASYYWGSWGLDLREWRQTVLATLSVEAYSVCPALPRLKELLNRFGAVALVSTGASPWASTTSTLESYFYRRKNNVTPAHVLAAMLTEDPVLDTFESPS